VLNLTSPTHYALLPTGAGDPLPLPHGTLAQLQWGAFFPDGKRIAFAGNEPGKATRLWVQDLSAGDPKPISAEGVAAGFGFSGNAISPDGSVIAATSDAGLALYPVAGGEPQPVKGAEATDQPLRFSVDGRFLYVRAFPRGPGFRLPARIFRLDLAKGTRELWKEIAPAGASSLGGITALVIAPDAGAYAYTYGEATATLYEVSGIR
jgi:dipeptidyl aminopeptidase/acylaminoacyl peptidase